MAIINILNNKIMKVLYIRISSVGQNNDRQKKEGFDLVFEDTNSGSIPLKERKEGKKLLKLVAAGSVNSIYIRMLISHKSNQISKLLFVSRRIHFLFH